MIALGTVKVLGRRILLILGHIGMAIVHCLVAIFEINGSNIGVLINVMLFLAIYQNTSGPIAWMYFAETTIDTAIGLCLMTLWGTTFFLSLICPILMDPASLGPAPVFFIYSGLSVLATFYVLYFIVESKGLSDKEKKNLYAPK